MVRIKKYPAVEFYWSMILKNIPYFFKNFTVDKSKKMYQNVFFRNGLCVYYREDS